MTRPANRMIEAVAKLAADFSSHAAVTITYSRGSSSVADVSATVALTSCEVMDGEVLVTHQFRDYVIQASALVIDDAQITPQNGDRITEESGDVYEVTAPKPMNAYDSIGPLNSVLKIHTKGPM